MGGPPRRDILPDYISIGRGTYGLDRNSFAGLAPECTVTVGNYSSFGPEVRIFCKTDHRTDLPSTFPFRTMLLRDAANADAVTRGPIKIGHDVWVGTRATILSGVTIGNGAVIGAGAVVSSDIAPSSVNVGVPAGQIRMGFEAAQIAALSEIAWWDWPEEMIRAEIETFYSDVDSFIARAREISR